MRRTAPSAYSDTNSKDSDPLSSSILKQGSNSRFQIMGNSMGLLILKIILPTIITMHLHGVSDEIISLALSMTFEKVLNVGITGYHEIG